VTTMALPRSGWWAGRIARACAPGCVVVSRAARGRAPSSRRLCPRVAGRAREPGQQQAL